MITQKAKGILIGLPQIMSEYPELHKFFILPPHMLISNIEHIKLVKKYFKSPFFARPCPAHPRHGFVDSITVSTNAELRQLWHNAKYEDDCAEMIIGPGIKDVSYNSVYVENGLLSVGSGNDGATGGNDSISFSVAPTEFKNNIKQDSDISEDDMLFIESIFGNNNWNIVQARGGPKIDGSSVDFIPKDTTIKKVITPSSDLIKWESEMINARYSPGTVVYGEGHTMASHAAIHAVINTIPFITSFKPKVGGKLKKSKLSEATKLNREEFKRGVYTADKIMSQISFSKKVEPDMFRMFYYAISVLHNWVYIRGSNHASWILGSASQLLLRICVSLCYGEYRHSKMNKLDDTSSRGNVYSKALRFKNEKMCLISSMFDSFNTEKWLYDYGGAPWATCALHTQLLMSSIVSTNNRKSKFIKDSESASIISNINKLTNLAHNNGWWFNKIADEDDFDFIAREPGLSALCVSQVYYDIYGSQQKSSVYDKLKVPPKLESGGGFNSLGLYEWVQLRYDGWRYSIVYTSEGGISKNSAALDFIPKDKVRAIMSKTKFTHMAISLPIVGDMIKIPGYKSIPFKSIFGNIER